MKPFEKWKTQEVKQTFGIQEVEKLAELEAWLQAKHEASEEEKRKVLKLQKRLKKFVDYWNEEELRVDFIAPLIDIVDFYEDDKYRPFMEITFGVEILDSQEVLQELRGRAEFLVATGEQIPQQSFFFIHEYKPHLKSQNDPKGQLLITMLASQKMNEPHQIPIYGLYTIGRNWYFMTLADQKFAVSNQYDASNEHMIWEIFSAIKQVKLYIEENYQKVVGK